MKDYRPLLLQTIDARLPEFHVKRLRLHKHLPEADALEDHRHRFSQILTYLSGGGTLRIGDQEHQVFPGAIACIPAGVTHGFRESSGRQPLSMAIDFNMSKTPVSRFGYLNQSESAGIRRELSSLSRLKHPDSSEDRLRATAAALGILDIQLCALSILPRDARAMPAFVKKFITSASDMDSPGKTIPEMAADTGFQADYLNRRFKQITGLTLLQQRDSIRLEKAKRLIRQGASIQEVAAAVGLDDPNYFSRWFKRHTGMPPSQYVIRP